MNMSQTQFHRRASIESDFEHIGDACGSAPMARFTRRASSGYDLHTSLGLCIVIENCVSLDRSRAKCEKHENAPLGNIPDCHTWTEEHITVQKRPFGTIRSTGAFLTLACVW